VDRARECVRGVTGLGIGSGYISSRDVEGTMRMIVLLIAATALFLCSVDVWAGGSRTTAADDAPVFLISNAL
jgi:hypothetical protein